jgi:hypothetical protein
MPPDAFLNRGYAFQAPIWNSSGIQEVLLTKVFRRARPLCNCYVALHATLTSCGAEADEEFVSILNDIREGRGQAAITALLRRCSRPLVTVHGIKPTELYSRNSDVDFVNARELDGITDSDLVTFDAVNSTYTKEEEKLDETGGYAARSNEAAVRQQKEILLRHEFWSNCSSPPQLHLKIGAQVMLLRNLELTGGAGRMLVNGSRGVGA